MLLGNLRRFESGGSESLSLRQIFYAFISNHLQRNSELKGSAYGFQGFKVHSSSFVRIQGALQRAEELIDDAAAAIERAL